jgi:hypothetical protein
LISEWNLSRWWISWVISASSAEILKSLVMCWYIYSR